MNRKALTDRWKSEAGQSLADEVVARLIAGRDLSELALDQHEGRVDLRYLPAPVPPRLQRCESEGWFVEKLGDLVEFHRARLENLDLSGAQLRSFRFHNTMSPTSSPITSRTPTMITAMRIRPGERVHLWAALVGQKRGEERHRARPTRSEARSIEVEHLTEPPPPPPAVTAPPRLVVLILGPRRRRAAPWMASSCSAASSILSSSPRSRNTPRHSRRTDARRRRAARTASKTPSYQKEGDATKLLVPGWIRGLCAFQAQPGKSG